MNIAFAGFRHGHITALYSEAARDPAFTIAGCFERDEAVRNEFARKGLSFAYDSFEALVHDPGVEAVAIGDYFAARGGMIIQALENGKHVICDKPLCTSPGELNRIRELCRKKALQAGCMLDLRFLPQVQKAREILAGGTLGEARTASFTGQHCLAYGERPGWYFEPGKHGGTINDLGIHGIDAIRFLTGKRLSRIHCARVWNAYAEHDPGFKDCAQFMADMDGLQIMGDVSYSAPAYPDMLPSYWRFEIWCSKGMLTFNWQTPEVHVYTLTHTVYACEKAHTRFLPEFLKSIQGLPSLLDTESILDSQEDTLKIQSAADCADDGNA